MTPDLASLDRRAITLWRLTTLFRGALFLALALAAEWVFEGEFPLGLVAAAVVASTAALAAVVPALRYRAWGYRLRDDDLYLRHGILFRTTSIVPHARIQHVDTRHGPLDRRLGLATLVVFTAGTRGAELPIPGLAAAVAEELRDRLAALSGAGDAV